MLYKQQLNMQNLKSFCQQISGQNFHLQGFYFTDYKSLENLHNAVKLLFNVLTIKGHLMNFSKVNAISKAVNICMFFLLYELYSTHNSIELITPIHTTFLRVIKIGFPYHSHIIICTGVTKINANS